MAMDPEVRALRAALAETGQPSYDSLSVTQARRRYRDRCLALQGNRPVGGLVRYLAARSPAGLIPLCLYLPDDSPKMAVLPAVVYFHGGGWVLGDAETHDTLCRQLADQSRVAVIAVDYRLAPEDKFPAAVDDAWAATQWIIKHAAAFGLDGGRIAVGGDGVGGTLATVVSITARDAQHSFPAFQLLMYPITGQSGERESRIVPFGDHLSTQEGAEWFMRHYLRSETDRADWRVAPLNPPLLKGLPPALIVTAGCDPLHDEGAAYAQRLRDAGVAVDYFDYGGMIHGFLSMSAVLKTANRALAHIAASLRQALS